MDWKDYEIAITKHFQKLFPEAKIQHNVSRIGLISRTMRQIDILIEGKIAGFDLTIIVDCKYFSKKVDVKDVESFLSYLQDLKASKGVLITNHGYSQAACDRATYDTRDIELRIINFDDLKRFQSFVAFPYFGKHGAVISAPDGWLIEAQPHSGALASFYPIGMKKGEAFHQDGYIYMVGSIKDADWPNLQHLIQVQENEIRGHYSNPKLEYEIVDVREDCDAITRVLVASEMPGTVEVTLFLDFPEAVVFFNLLTPETKYTTYYKKLLWIAEKMIKLKVIYSQGLTPLTSVRDDA